MRNPPSRPGETRDPLIGHVISGRYRVLSVIARGSMGKVYRAEQVPLGRPVALKVLSPSVDDPGMDNIQDSEFYQRFFREAETLARLSNPHTVTIFDYGSDEDVYYIAMEYLEGQTLSDLIHARGYLDPARVIEIARQICQSLQEAHAQDVIHRDLKPSNVVLQRNSGGEDFVKLLDFGLVKKLRSDRQEDLTQVGTVAGSPKYIAPEQVRGQRLDARADIYSLGVILYQMLVGKVPFDHPNPMDILLAHVNKAPPPLQVANPRAEVPAALQQIVMTCIAKQPDGRFRDITHLLEALKQAAIELKIGHVPTSTGHVASPAPAPPSSPAIRRASPPLPERRREPPPAPAEQTGGPGTVDAQQLWLSPEDETTVHARPAARSSHAWQGLAAVIIAGFAAAAVYLLDGGESPDAGVLMEPVVYQNETFPSEPASPAGQPADSLGQPATSSEQPVDSFQQPTDPDRIPVTPTGSRSPEARPQELEPGTTRRVETEPKPVEPRAAGPDTARPKTTEAREQAPLEEKEAAETRSTRRNRAEASSEPTVEITLRSTPPGATVFIDELEVGNTPTTLTWQGPGASQGHKLVVEFVKDGYFDTVIRQPIQGNSLVFDVALEPQVSIQKKPSPPSSPVDRAPADEPEKVSPSENEESKPPPKDEAPEPPPKDEAPEPPPEEKKPETPPAPPDEDDAPPLPSPYKNTP